MTATTATLDAVLTADCRRANETPMETGPAARSSSRPCGASPACPGECTKFSITRLSGINDFRGESRTAPGQTYQPRLHRGQNLFPRNTRSFFSNPDKSPSQTGTPRPPAPSDDESPATTVAEKGSVNLIVIFPARLRISISRRRPATP